MGYYEEFRPFEEAWNKFWLKHKSTGDPCEVEIVLQIKRRIAEIHDLIKKMEAPGSRET